MSSISEAYRIQQYLINRQIKAQKLKFKYHFENSLHRLLMH